MSNNIGEASIHSFENGERAENIKKTNHEKRMIHTKRDEKDTARR